MIEKLEGFGQYLVAAGFKDVKINDADRFLREVRAKTLNECVQFFDALFIAGSDHLRFAALNALNAFKNKLNISSSLAMETLLYASGQHQIKEAIKLVGIKSTSRQIVALILAETPGEAHRILEAVSKLVPGKQSDSVLELSNSKTKRVRKLFRISDLELEAKTEKQGGEKQALLDLVIEHMALLATER